MTAVKVARSLTAVRMAIIVVFNARE